MVFRDLVLQLGFLMAAAAGVLVAWAVLSGQLHTRRRRRSRRPED